MSARRLLAAVRGLATLPGFAALTRSPALLRVSFSLRGTLTATPRRFARAELSRSPATRVYRLRHAPVAVALRHHTPDVLALDEVFAKHEYEPPPEAAAALDRSADPLRVADLGANVGMFGAWARTRWPDARIVSYEPDPANAEVCRLTIAANGGEPGWRLIEACASNHEGTTAFAAGQFTLSHAAEPGEAGALEVRCDDVLPELALSDLVKIDIEGGEWPILEDPRFTELRPRAIVLEYHGDGCPSSDPGAAARAALARTGLHVGPALEHREHGTGILWAWRT
jgi:FkbM family methyltransferase